MMLTRISRILVAGILLLLVFSGCRGRDSVSSATWDAEEAESFPTAVEVVSVEQGKLYGSIRSAATVRGKNEARIVAGSQGLVKAFLVRPGQEIREGDAIVRLDDELAAFSAEQARTVWDIARADLEVLISLHERGNASRIDLERARSSERGARAAYEQGLKILQDRTIRSPIDGSIAWINENASPGNYVTAGTLVALVVDVSGFTLMLELGERQIGLVGPGAVAEIRVAAAGNTPFFGTVDAVAAGSDGTAASYQVDVSFNTAADSGIKPGMTARIIMETNREMPVLLVPGAALLNSGTDSSVFLLHQGRVRLTAVKVASRYGDFAAVESGLKAGDHVLVSGTRRLIDGAPVQATEIRFVRQEM